MTSISLLFFIVHLTHSLLCVNIATSLSQCFVRQGSYCIRSRLNFQAFLLRDMTIAARESCRECQKKSIALVYAN